MTDTGDDSDVRICKKTLSKLLTHSSNVRQEGSGFGTARTVERKLKSTSFLTTE